MQETRLELLKAMPVFGGLSEEALTLLLNLARVVAVPKDQFFFREDDDASSMFVLEKGRVAVIKRWRDKEYLMRHLDTGDCFGELALMDFRPRSASVLAVEDCSALELSAGVLQELYHNDLRQFTLIQMNMGREVSRRLCSADEQLFERLAATQSVEDNYTHASI